MRACESVSAIILIASAAALQPAAAHAQASTQHVALKSGESVELFPVYWVTNCRLTMLGLPEIEILDGPPELTLSIREEMVLPRRQGCANRVPGGTLVATARQVQDASQAKLTFRLKFKTKDGPRQTAHAYNVSLFP
jgi:hypothetical protein